MSWETRKGRQAWARYERQRVAEEVISWGHPREDAHQIKVRVGIVSKQMGN